MPSAADFLPPIPLPRRMWAGSRLSFANPIRVGTDIERRSEIIDITAKNGASGQLVVVKVRHVISSGGVPAVTEEHDIIYRDAPAKTSAPSVAAAPKEEKKPPSSAIICSITPDIVRLFRFSALTFNGHRIHYDRDYAREEGYPGLVVHGPLIAVLLMDHFYRHRPKVRVTEFNVRFQSPLFDIHPFDLCLEETDGGADLRAFNKDGKTCATATLAYAR